MNLVKEHWLESDLKEFQQYLLTLSRGAERGQWEQRIVNTALPCLAIPSPEIERIVREITRGNAREFIDLWGWDTHQNTVIIGKLICHIKDHSTMCDYLTRYSHKVDNWASIDLLKFKVNTANRARYLEFARACLKDKYTFTRRLGVIIMLKIINDDNIDEILTLASGLKQEEEYYVNMANAWLIAECFIKYREPTLRLLDSGLLNPFVMNKAISKCRDSYRVSKDDKDMLVKFRIKTK